MSTSILRRGLAVAITLSVLGCSRQNDAEKKSAGDDRAQNQAQDGADAAVAFERLGPWAGTLPCADCAGIETQLTLFRARGEGGAPLVYHLSETYRDAAGDRTVTRSGRWTLARGTGAHATANVYHLDPDKPEEQRGFRVVSDDTLRLLDRSLGEIESPQPYTLVRRESVLAPLFIEGGDPVAIDLRLGQEFFVRLPANRTTGFQWALADTARTVVAPQSTQYVQDAPSGLAVGVGGNEYWRLRAIAAGSRLLVFVYRRPWESQPPARTAEVTATVR